MTKIEFINAKEFREEALKLHISENQRGTIETVEECLNEADELELWKPMLISIDDVYVGFAMFGLWIYEGDHGRLWLDRFFIDEHHQGKGLAKLILPILLEKLYKDYAVDKIFLSVYETNELAIHLYEKLGFKFNGELDINNERVMVKSRS